MTSPLPIADLGSPMQQLRTLAITHLAYCPKFTQVVEQKHVAQQETECSKFLIVCAEQEICTTVVRAEGESEATGPAGGGNGSIGHRKWPN
jgi:hypothetical protein